MTLTEAILAIYLQVGAPDWAAANLDALADVLRDLSWLPAGPIHLVVPELAEPDATQLRAVLWQVAGETADGPRPIVPSE
jgi:Barstar (barnase inhibitor)